MSEFDLRSKRLIPVRIWEESYTLLDGIVVTQTGARCTRCGYDVVVDGTGESAELKCAKLLRRECRLGEENTYVPSPDTWH